MRPTSLKPVGTLAGLAIALAALIAFALAGPGTRGAGEPDRAGPIPTADRPNVVVVMTDDQAVDTMAAMPRVRRLLGDRGVTYKNAIVSFPLCCPSRASFLTGQYAHNHGVRNNGGPNGGYARLDARRTLPVWLQRAGYRTGFVGKFLNGYGEGDAATEVPPGWDDWFALPGEAKQRAWEFDLNENGTMVSYRAERRRYKTAVLADKAAALAERGAAGRRPFFLWVATNGPHRDSHLPETADRNPEPAPRDRGRFDRVRAPGGPALNETDVSDKPRTVRGKSRLDRPTRDRLQREYVSQLESLLSIDRLVARLVRKLRAAGELDDTVFVFTSDNGFLRGQHRLEGKSRVYEEAIRVPLLIRGPGFPEDETSDELVANIDLAATILEASGAEPDVAVDGRGIRPGRPQRDAVLLEVFERKQAFTGVRTPRFAYAEYETGERELYDLASDPHELDNVAGDPRYAAVRTALAGRLAELRSCSGAAECG